MEHPIYFECRDIEASAYWWDVLSIDWQFVQWFCARHTIHITTGEDWQQHVYIDQPPWEIGSMPYGISIHALDALVDAICAYCTEQGIPNHIFKKKPSFARSIVNKMLTAVKCLRNIL